MSKSLTKIQDSIFRIPEKFKEKKNTKIIRMQNKLIFQNRKKISK